MSYSAQWFELLTQRVTEKKGALRLGTAGMRTARSPSPAWQRVSVSTTVRASGKQVLPLPFCSRKYPQDLKT